MLPPTPDTRGGRIESGPCPIPHLNDHLVTAAPRSLRVSVWISMMSRRRHNLPRGQEPGDLARPLGCPARTLWADIAGIMVWRSGRGISVSVEGRLPLRIASCYVGAIVINHRTGVQELSSVTDLTMPLTVARPKVRVATSPRYWAGLDRVIGFDLLHVVGQSVHERQVVMMSAV